MPGAFDQNSHYPLVHLVWNDHWSEDAWMDIDDAANKAPHNEIHSVGWLVKEDEIRYLICNNIADDKTGCMFMCILKGTVVKFEILANGSDHIFPANDNLVLHPLNTT